jgi:hypothetical protein
MGRQREKDDKQIQMCTRPCFVQRVRTLQMVKDLNFRCAQKNAQECENIGVNAIGGGTASGWDRK